MVDVDFMGKITTSRIVCFLNLTFQQPGPHPFVLSVNDRESKRLVLWVTTI